MTVSASIDCGITATETVPTSPLTGTGGNTRSFNEANISGVVLNGSSTPSIDTVVDLSHTLSGGTTKDFDLTAAPLARDPTQTVDLTGKKLVLLMIQANANNNVAGIVLAPQGGNGYDLFGSSGQMTIYPGMQVQYAFYAAASQLDAVAAAAKDLRFTGTDGDIWKAVSYFG